MPRLGSACFTLLLALAGCGGHPIDTWQQVADPDYAGNPKRLFVFGPTDPAFQQAFNASMSQCAVQTAYHPRLAASLTNDPDSLGAMAALHADSYMTIEPSMFTLMGTTLHPNTAQYDSYKVTLSDLVTRTEVWTGTINGNPKDGTHFANEIAFLLRRNNIVKDCQPGPANSAISHAMLENKDGHLQSFH